MQVILSIPDTKMRKTDPVKRKEAYEKRREQILADMKSNYNRDPFKMRARQAAYYQENKDRIKQNRIERMRGRPLRYTKSSAPRDYFPRKPETVETVRALPLLFKDASFSVTFD